MANDMMTVDQDREFSFWRDSMLRRMARDGVALPPNADELASEVCKLFRNMAFHPLATAMAVSHRYAIDIIRQAPIIVQAANRGAGIRLSNLGGIPTAVHIGGQLGKQVERGDKLATILSRYLMPLQFRQLHGFALAPKRWDPLWHLRTAKPSSLAQIIPAAKSRQNMWLYLLTKWANHMERRTSGQRAGLLIEWAARALGPVAEHNMDITTVADFALHRGGGETFCTDWSWEEANAAAMRWHATMAKQKDEASFLKAYGVEWEQPIDYMPFPLTATIDGHDIVALNTGAEIYLEGVAMHHCVRSYSGEVVKGEARLFSIRRGNKRVATMELARETNRMRIQGQDGQIYSKTPAQSVDAPWRVVQIKGPCNAAVSKATMAIAENWFREVSGLGRTTTPKDMDVDGIRASILAAARPEPDEID